MESEIIPHCKSKNIQIIAWRPLKQGELVIAGIEDLEELSERYNKTLAQIAINWLISKDIVTIPMSANTDHLKENLGSLHWRLNENDQKLLDNLMK